MREGAISCLLNRGVIQKDGEWRPGGAMTRPQQRAGREPSGSDTHNVVHGLVWGCIYACRHGGGDFFPALYTNTKALNVV